MEINTYQELAFRTVNTELSPIQMERHALHGITSEVGEIHAIYQKEYQGHEFNETQLKSELGDLMWFIAELCSAMEWSLSDICEQNIEKLRKRFPDGFETYRSLNRSEDDI